MSAANHDMDDWEAGPPERLDEAFALLRGLPATAWMWCVAGPVPMVLGILFSWTDLARGGVPVLAAPQWAVCLAAAYAWLKITQAFFARAVWGQLLPEGGLPSLSVGEWFRRTGALLAVAAAGVPVQAAGALVVVPFGWVFAYFQHAAALAYTHDLGPRPLRALVRVSGRLSLHEPLAHHMSLLLLGVLSSLVWVSVYALGLLVPYLLKMLTGVESGFTRNPLAVAFNSLYLTSSVGVAWMIMNPYVRVAYVLRTFHVLSRRTGDDLLGRLHAARKRGAAVAGGMVLACLLAPGAVAGGAVADVDRGGMEAPVVEADAGELAEAIRDTLAGREYRWRLPRADRAAEEGDGLWATVKEAFRTVREVLRDIGRMLDDAGRALRRMFGGGGPEASTGSGAGAGLTGDALRGLLYVAGAAAVLAGVVVWFRWRRRPPAVAAAVAVPSAVNLADESTLASALPEDEWLKLARVQWDGGDLRLAVRAVFLATLAALGERRLIDIARSKSNRDYALELRLRTAGRLEVPALFARSIGVFERAWYGWHDVAPEWVQELLDNHQRLTSHGTPS